jgi:hypothetical protein
MNDWDFDTETTPQKARNDRVTLGAASGAQSSFEFAAVFYQVQSGAMVHNDDDTMHDMRCHDDMCRSCFRIVHVYMFLVFNSSSTKSHGAGSGI